MRIPGIRLRSKDERTATAADNRARFDHNRTERLRDKTEGRSVVAIKYLSTDGYSNDADRMAALGFDVATTTSNRRGGGLTVTYRRR